MGTFSIVAYDEIEDAFGVAVCSKSIAVGSRVPWAKAGVGAIATQAFTNVRYGIEGLKLLEKGYSAKKTLEVLLSRDKRREERHVGIIDRNKEIAVHTGRECVEWAGHKVGKYYAVLGNLIVGEVVIEKMAYAYETYDGDFIEKLMAAIDAGFVAGGDRRGHSSAAILVVKNNLTEEHNYSDRLIDLRVDFHTNPIYELKRILELYRTVYNI